MACRPSLTPDDAHGGGYIVDRQREWDIVKGGGGAGEEGGVSDSSQECVTNERANVLCKEGAGQACLLNPGASTQPLLDAGADVCRAITANGHGCPINVAPRIDRSAAADPRRLRPDR